MDYFIENHFFKMVIKIVIVLKAFIIVINLFGISASVGNLMPKPSLENNSGTIESIATGALTFSKGMSSKVDTKARLEFELAY